MPRTYDPNRSFCKLIIDGNETWHGTLTQFFQANALNQEEASAIADAFEKGDTYEGGGGAEAK